MIYSWAAHSVTIFMFIRSLQAYLTHVTLLLSMERITMQNFDTLRISIQDRNDRAAEEHKIANKKIKNDKMLKQESDITENILSTHVKVQHLNDTIDLNCIAIVPSSSPLSPTSENLTFGHLKPIEQRKHEPMEFHKIGELSTNIPFKYQSSGGSVFNKTSERVKKQ